jgi:GntR family transcriptional regulator, rspAB operon transcriptional repressor
MENKVKDSKDNAYNRIQELILRMDIKPGELVTEISLSKRLKIGRTPIREALKKIEQEGLIFTLKHRKRVYVLTLKELEEIFDIKICLESYVAECAANNNSSIYIEELKKNLDDMEKAVSFNVHNDEEEKKRLNDWLNADRNLHHMLFKMADKPKIEPIIRNLDLQWQRLQLGIYTLEGRMKRSHMEHKKFVQAIIDHKPEEANKLMREHLKTVSNELVKLFRMFNYPIQ